MQRSRIRAERDGARLTAAPPHRARRGHDPQGPTTRRSAPPASPAALPGGRRPGTDGREATAPSGSRRRAGGVGECGSARRRFRYAARSRTRLAADRIVPRGNNSAREIPAESGEPMQGHERRVGHGLSRSGGEPGPALQSSLLQQCPPRAGLHPMAKPVLLVAPAVVGLERALHAWPPRAQVRRADHGARRPGTAAQTAQCTAEAGVLSLQRAGDTVPTPRQRTGPVGAVTSPEMFTFGLGEAARAAAGPGEGFLHTCGCCCGQPG